MHPPTLGFIGGSGLYALEAFDHAEIVNIDTPWGSPSDAVHIGVIGSTRVAFLSRHGTGHRLSPSEVPYAANVAAMKMIGVRHLVSISAVGSLIEDAPPRSFVVPDQLLDRTVGRRRTFFDDGIVAHVGMAEPFCRELSAAVAEAAADGDLPVRTGGAYVCIEGPQFSTRFESELFRSWGCSVIGMTALPEARLAREAQLCYACLAMVTDYDVWHHSGESVNVELVIGNLMAMTSAVQRIVTLLAARESFACTSECSTALDQAIITDRTRVDETTRSRLAPIVGTLLESPS
jgi:5'-methylthioadenosine phosphorylase